MEKEEESEMSLTNTEDKECTDNATPNANSQPPQKTVVDRGYAWVVMVAVFLTLVFHAIVSTLQTILFQVFLVRFELDATTSGWIVSLPSSVRFLSSPLVGLLYLKLSVRTAAMIGSVVQTLGFLSIAFGTETWVLYFGSILMGFGSNMFIMSAFILIPQYFVQHRGFAMGFALCGFNVGNIFNAPLATWSFEYFGVTQTLILLSGGLLQTVVTTALFRPQVIPKQTSNTDTESDKTSTQSKWEVIKQKYGLGLLGKPVLVYLMILSANIHCLIIGSVVFVSGLGTERMDMSPNELAAMLSLSAFLGFVKIPAGFLLDRPRLRPYRMYIFSGCCIVAGLLLFTMSFTTTPISMTVCYSAFIAFAWVSHSQYTNMLADLVRMSDMPNVIALTRTMTGISLLLTPVIMGRIKDLKDSFQLSFIVISLMHVFLAIGYIIVYACWNKRMKSRESETAITL